MRAACAALYSLQDQFLLGSDILAHQKFISPVMRTILVDWLVELQENFELYHETLYLTVKLADHYLARKVVRKEYLQLVGAASMLLASKFEVCGGRRWVGVSMLPCSRAFELGVEVGREFLCICRIYGCMVVCCWLHVTSLPSPCRS